MGKIIKTDGSEKQVRPVNGRQFELEELRNICGGDTITVNLHDGKVMVIIRYSSPRFNVNWQATEIASEAMVLDGVEFILGNVLICDEEEVL